MAFDRKRVNIKRIAVVALASIVAFVCVIALLLLLTRLFLPPFILSRVNSGINGTVDSPEISFESGKIRIEKPVLTTADGKKCAQAQAILVEYGYAELARTRSMASAIRKIEIVKPELLISRNEKGVFNVTTIAKEKGAGLPWDTIAGDFNGSLFIRDGRVEFHDLFRRRFSTTMEGVNMALEPGRDQLFRLTFNAIEKGAKPSPIKGSAVIDFKRPHLQLSLVDENEDLASWGNYLMSNEKMRFTGGVGNLTMEIRGSGATIASLMSSLYFQGALTVKGVNLYFTPLDAEAGHIEGRLEFGQNYLEIQKLAGLFQGSKVALSGMLYDFTDPVLDMNVTVDGLTMDKLRALKSYRSWKGSDRIPQAQGALCCDLHVSGALNNPEVEGKIGLVDGNIYDLQVKEAEIEGTFSSGALRINRLRSKVNGGEVSGYGWIFPSGNQMLISLKGRDSALAWKTKKGESIGGVADFALDILGEPSKPVVMGRALFQQLNVGREVYGRSFADFILNDDTLFLKEGMVSRSGGLLKASGMVDLKEEQLDLSLRASSFPVNSELGSHAGSVRGELSGIMKVFGPFSTPLAYGIIGPPGFLKVGSLTLTDPYVPIRYDGDILSVSHGVVTCEGTPLEFGGDIQVSPSPFLQIALRSQKTSLSALSRQLSIPLSVGGTGDLRATLTGGPSVGFLWKGEGRVNKGTIHSTGWLGPDNRWLSAVSMEKIPLDSMNVTLNRKGYPLKGSLDYGEALLSGNSRNVSIGCSLYFMDSSFLGFPFASVYGDALLSGAGIAISEADVRGPAGRVSFGGEMEPGKNRYALSGDAAALNVDYLCRNLDLSPWGINIMQEMEKRNLSSIQGLFWAKGTLKNSGSMPRFDGEVSLKEGLYASEILSLESGFSIVPHTALINSLVVHAGKSTYEGRGKIVYDPQVSMDMAVTIKKGDIARIIALTPWKELSLKGDLNGSFQIRGKPAALLVDGSALVTGGAIGGQPIRQISVDLNTRQNDLYLDNLRVEFPSGQIHGSGKITPGGLFDMSFNGENFPLENVKILEKYVGKLDGKVNFDMKVGGSRKKPEISLSFNAQDLTVNRNRSYSGDGTLHWKDNTLFIDQVTMRHEDEQYGINGSVTFPGRIPLNRQEWLGKKDTINPLLDIKADLQNAQLGNIVGSLSGTGDISGNVDGQISVKGDLKAPSYAIDVVVRNGKLKGIPVERALARVQYEDRRLIISGVEVKLPSSSLEIKGNIGSVDDSSDNEVTIDAQNLDMALFSSLLPRGMKLGGVLDMNARVSGSLMFPDVTSQIKVSRGYWGGFDFDSITGKVIASKGVFSCRDFFIDEKGSRIKVSGDVPLMYDRGKVRSTAPMDVQMSIKAGDLDFLSIFVPLDGKTSGTMDGNMEISGVFPDIVLEGSMAVRKGQIQPAVLKQPVTDMKAMITFADEKIKIKSMEGKIGQGTFSVGGELDISGSSIKSVDLKMLAKDLEIYAKKYYSGKTDMDLTLKGDASQQALLGRIVANSATITIPTEVLMKDPEDNEKMLEELKKSVPSSLRNLFVNVQVDLNNDNWFTFLTSSLLMKGGITVAGRIPELALSGEVDLYRGTLNLPFLETPFKVYQGKAYFDGQDWSPSLALEAEADIGNYRVYMDYTGKMENPRVELTSEPPMRQDELQRMITGGAPGAPGAPGVPGMSSSFVLSGELAANAMATRLAERVMDLNLIQPLFHAIGRTFGLSDVALEYTYDGFWSVRVAKALDARERLLVTYDRVLLTNGVTQNLYGIEYRFQRGMLVRVSQDDQGRYYYWVQTKYRF